MKMTRDTSLDILRSLIMFMIVLGHSLLHGGVLDNAGVFSATYFCWIFFECFFERSCGLFRIAERLLGISETVYL